jgi:hypothetical protein
MVELETVVLDLNIPLFAQAWGRIRLEILLAGYFLTRFGPARYARWAYQLRLSNNSA